MSSPGDSDRVEVYKDEAGEYRWKRIAPNNRIVADGGEGYTHLHDCMTSAERQGLAIVINAIVVKEEGDST
jgi:uncharacterized protein YegP (UPF0339 family)